MRRSAAVVVAFAATLGTALSLLPAASSSAAEAEPAAPAPAAARIAEPSAEPVELKGDQALETLKTAERVMAGKASRDGSEPEATFALRDLLVAMDKLPANERRRAKALLARPSQGSGDPYGNGYTARAKRKCSSNLCVHWVSTTGDAASTKQAKRTLKTMNKVWKHHVKRMGYRKPATDGNRGGNKKFDVYLANVGAQGVYGYCAPERIADRRYPKVASGFCVLDNDFKEFRGRPKDNLKVTAAHEFLHAIQFAYDYQEDRWFMESTATWIEERYADGVNDNRQYLPAGQTQVPNIPLDTYYVYGGQHYGNWPFWEYLSQRYGSKIVRQTWERAGAYRGAPDQYSIKAVSTVLKKRGGFPAVFAAYSAGNTMVAKTYREGRTWKKSAPLRKSWKLSRNKRKGAAKARVDQLTSASYLARPNKSLKAKKWKLRVTVKGPGAKTSPAAHVIVKMRNGKIKHHRIKLSRKGNGKVVVPFSRRKVKSVTITVANASTRSRCGRISPSSPVQFACLGTHRDDNRQFRVAVAVRK